MPDHLIWTVAFHRAFRQLRGGLAPDGGSHSAGILRLRQLSRLSSGAPGPEHGGIHSLAARCLAPGLGRAAPGAWDHRSSWGMSPLPAEGRRGDPHGDVGESTAFCW